MDSAGAGPLRVSLSHSRYGVLGLLLVWLGGIVVSCSPDSGGSSDRVDRIAERRVSGIFSGERLYQRNCQVCHQSNGAGIRGVFPPLVGTKYVLGSEERLIALVLYGLQGPFEVDGVMYNGVMPGHAATLPDEQVAAILTYIRTSWGNEAPEITADQVREVRAAYDGRTDPWTEQELRTTFGE